MLIFLKYPLCRYRLHCRPTASWHGVHFFVILVVFVNRWPMFSTRFTIFIKIWATRNEGLVQSHPVSTPCLGGAENKLESFPRILIKCMTQWSFNCPPCLTHREWDPQDWSVFFSFPKCVLACSSSIKGLPLFLGSPSFPGISGTVPPPQFPPFTSSQGWAFPTIFLQFNRFFTYPVRIFSLFLLWIEIFYNFSPVFITVF